MGWLSFRVKKPEKTWWYVSYAFVQEEKLHCHAMVYTLTCKDFSLHAIERDLKKRTATEFLTVLAWHKLNEREGTKIVAYFKLRADEVAKAKPGEEAKDAKKRIYLVEDTDGT